MVMVTAMEIIHQGESTDRYKIVDCKLIVLEEVVDMVPDRILKAVAMIREVCKIKQPHMSGTGEMFIFKCSEGQVCCFDGGPYLSIGMPIIIKYLKDRYQCNVSSYSEELDD